GIRAPRQAGRVASRRRDPPVGALRPGSSSTCLRRVLGPPAGDRGPVRRAADASPVRRARGRRGRPDRRLDQRLLRAALNVGGGKALLILGTRGFAVEVAEVAGESGWRVAGFVENWVRSRCEETLEGLPVHWIDDLAALAAGHVAVCALGTTKRGGFVLEA